MVACIPSLFEAFFQKSAPNPEGLSYPLNDEQTDEITTFAWCLFENNQAFSNHQEAPALQPAQNKPNEPNDSVYQANQVFNPKTHVMETPPLPPEDSKTSQPQDHKSPQSTLSFKQSPIGMEKDFSDLKELKEDFAKKPTPHKHTRQDLEPESEPAPKLHAPTKNTLNKEPALKTPLRQEDAHPNKSFNPAFKPAPKLHAPTKNTLNKEPALKTPLRQENSQENKSLGSEELHKTPNQPKTNDYSIPLESNLTHAMGTKRELGSIKDGFVMPHPSKLIKHIAVGLKNQHHAGRQHESLLVVDLQPKEWGTLRIHSTLQGNEISLHFTGSPQAMTVLKAHTADLCDLMDQQGFFTSENNMHFKQNQDGRAQVYDDILHETSTQHDHSPSPTSSLFHTRKGLFA